MKNYKFKIKNGTARLRHALGLCFFLPFTFLIFNCSATPYFVQLFQSDGSATNFQIGVSFWPPSDSPFNTYGTNVIYGNNVETVALNNGGYGSNWLFPGTYRFYITNLNAAFIAVIPDTTNFLSIANYTTNLPGFPGVGLNSFGIVTNWLGYTPATNNFKGITNSLGYMPATNSNVGIVFALGFTPATNNYNGVTNSLGFAPSTNTFVGVTNALGYMPATNSNAGAVFALGFTPATNNYNGVTNSLGFPPATNSFIGTTNALHYMPATNSSAGIDFALGYTPRTNDGNIGLISGAASFATNGGSVWVTYNTNNVPGPAFTNLPPGAIMTTTNGAFFVLSNLVWNPK